MPWQQLVADVAGELDPATGGLFYRRVVVTVMRQQGKALDVSTPILTAGGWSTMGALQVGDEVYAPDGHLVPVTFVSAVMHGHDCYRVTTTDGRSVVADADHLWSVIDKKPFRQVRRVMTTAELLDAGLDRRVDGRERRFVLPHQGVLKSPDVDLPIDPYLFGFWLGDGSSDGGQVWIGDEDIEASLTLLRSAGCEFVSVKRMPTAWRVRIQGLHAGLQRMGVLGSKRIPDLFLTAGTAQRLALLQGLLDTDGSVTASQVEFCSMSQDLAASVLFLARSLGWRASFHSDPAKIGGRVVGVRHRVRFTAGSDDQRPFRLPRKVARLRPLKTRGTERVCMSIASIISVPSRPVRCIQVDSADSLYLAGRDLIPTHNTTIQLPMMVDRCLTARRHVTYAAQSGVAARDKLLDEHWPLVARSPLRRLVRLRRTTGHEGMLWQNGSRHTITSTRESAGHGTTLDAAVVDEAFAYPDARLEQAFVPAMQTRPDPQLIIMSTAGYDEVRSPWLWQQVMAGRERVESGESSRTCYFEWSFSLDDDPFSEVTWRRRMPALGRTTSVDAIRAAAEGMERSEFLRAFGNVWGEGGGVRALDQDAWNSCGDAASRIDGPVSFALAVSDDGARRWGCLAAAGLRGDGLMHVEVVVTRPGSSWMVQEAVARVQRNGGRLTVVKGTPAAGLTPALQGAGVEVVEVSQQEAAQACMRLADQVGERKVRHLRQPALDFAAANARPARSGELWRFAGTGDRDVSPLTACALAGWQVTASPGPPVFAW